MGLISAKQERRKVLRYCPQEGSYIVISTKVGQLADISKQGLSFIYLADGENIQDQLELDLFCTDHSFYIERLPYQTVFDLVIAESSDFSATLIRRRGVKFGELSSHQLDQLDKFLCKNTHLEK